ncbi:MAG TPA: imidazole glycerol phosphate synthase subunit HisH [Myxococcota bacterium]|jgi:glutamine amidotransferase
MSSAPRIAVVDYGAGNLRSVARALARSGLEPVVTGDPEALRRADGVVLPGVGAFAAAAASLAKTGLGDAVLASIDAGRPYLGLCLGLQLLFEAGDEHGITPGLGLLPGRVTRFPERDASGAKLRVPHIGWNEVRYRGAHPMLATLGERELYYFVHAYRAEPAREADVVGRVDYGGDFAAAVAAPNLFAVQFHPEKSQAAGKRLLDAYAAWVAQIR